jgi:hypothetical protein
MSERSVNYSGARSASEGRPLLALRAPWFRDAWRNPPNLLSVLLIVLIGANYFGVFADLDFAWQVRTGEHIVQTGQIRNPEPFSYTIQGQSIPDFEWLYEVVLYAVYSTFGFGGLKFLRVVLVATPLLIVGLRLRGEGVRWHGIALTLFVAIFVLAPAWNLRPLYCTTIGLLLVSWWLHDHCTGRRPLTWWLPVVMFLWANLHPGVITGQALLLGAIIWEWLNRWVKLNPPLDHSALKRLTLIGSVGLAATFLSPAPLERLLYPFSPDLAHPIFRAFVEMQPTWYFLSKPPFAVAMAYVVAALVAVSVVLRFRYYRMWEVALLLGLTLLANVAFRSLQDWLLGMLSLGVPHLVVLLRDAARVDRRRALVAGVLRLDRSWKRLLVSPMLRFQLFWPAATVGLLLAVSLLPPLSRAMPLQNSPEWPVAAVDHIEKTGLDGNFFAPPDYSSFLVWRLPGTAKSYTDTRGFFFPPELVEDCILLPQLCPDWRERLGRVLDGYPTEYLLLETTGARGELWRILQPHMAAPLYLDEKTVLLSAAQVRQGWRQIDLQLAAK